MSPFVRPWRTKGLGQSDSSSASGGLRIVHVGCQPTPQSMKMPSRWWASKVESLWCHEPGSESDLGGLKAPPIVAPTMMGST